MTVLRASDLVVSGKLVKAKHPFANPNMRKIAEALGKPVPSDALVIRTPPPWAKARDYLHAMTENQLKAIVWFAEKNIELAERYKSEPKYVRLMKRLQELKGFKGTVHFGRTPKPKRMGYMEAKRMLEGVKAGMPTPATAEMIEL